MNLTIADRLGRRRRRPEKPFRGVAATEFAFVLPVLIVLTLGTMDVCSMFFLKESAVLAAYEASRAGVSRDRTNADATARAIEFLDERNISYDANVISFSTPGFDTADTLEMVTVTVQLPAAGNLLVPSAMFGDLMVTANVTMRKEYKNLPTSGFVE